MAVYKRSYATYSGPLTPRWSRLFILTRYSAKTIFQSRIVTGLFVICFFYPLLMAAALYLNHNASVLSLLKFKGDALLEINGKFFLVFMTVQSSLAYLMTAFIGPGLISPDLVNNGLPLYFCRPLSRTEYVVGRGAVLVMVLSLITWVPGLILYGIESSLSGLKWAADNLNYAWGMFLGSMLWIVFLSLLAMALSAWVRWRLVAGALLLGTMFVSSGFAAAINGILRTKAGFYLDPAVLVAAVYTNIFDINTRLDITTPGAVASLLVICSVCVWILFRKVRAFEVVR